MNDCYRIDDVSRIISPGLVVFRELVERNIDAMIRLAGGVDRLRPHCKTHKMREVAEMELAKGITKHKAATLAEAEMLAEAGVKDIFLAYNLVGPNIDRAVAFRRKYPDVWFAVTADDPQSLARLGEAMRAAGTTLPVLLDINPGRDRTGLSPGPEAVAFYRRLCDTAGIEPAGLHLYDGHQHQSDPTERRTAIDAVWSQVAALRDTLVEAGCPVPRIVAGGTPQFPIYAQFGDPTIELSPGTCVFHDASYGEKFPDLAPHFTPAALVLTRVISRPTGDRVTFDCGTKGVASDPPMGSRVVLPAIPDGEQVLQNEEHLVIQTPHAGDWQPGDWTLAIPRHVCPTSALHKQAYVVADGQVVGMWNVASRDRWLTI